VILGESDNDIRDLRDWDSAIFTFRNARALRRIETLIENVTRNVTPFIDSIPNDTDEMFLC
jgi:hypothetical protein